MTQDQILIIAILVATIAMFLWGRWRHDMVAIGALLACVLAGLVPASQAFNGFAHPAVITVACVLVLSRGLQTSGVSDLLARRMLPQTSSPTLTIAALTGLAALLSAFMNNVGALALLMPIAIQIAVKQGLPPGQVLMPVAFGSILGGMTTLIGTPPNLIVSGFRLQASGESFAMFDFTPVGLSVAAGGVLFVALVGWKLVPARKRADVEGFETGAYLTEARVGERAKAASMTFRQVEEALEESGAQVVALIRNDMRMVSFGRARVVRPGDILVIEAEPEALASALSDLGLTLEEAVTKAAAPETSSDEKAEAAAEKEAAAAGDSDETPARASQSDEIALMELAVLPDSGLIGRSATDIHLRTRFGINLLAVSRQGRRSIMRLRTMPIRGGDVLLVQGAPEALLDFAGAFGCVPLAERPLRLPDRRQATLAVLIMVAAVAGAALGLLPAAISFTAGLLATMAFKVIPLRTVYNAIDWPVVVLLGALIPVADAMGTTGAADLVAHAMLNQLAGGHAVLALAILLVVTMTLSDFMNNAATAAVMCPIAIGAAAQLEVSIDPLLMAVAVGSSCAFLTPIGHQNNTLILGPGGFRFGDYWRLGLPLEILVFAIGVPLILFVWPL
ncbi:MAG TPA: SLC13 family permease [Alphaproteobacteria bacterium]|nr:SLC13 family permease [Alphaproteobacteria bacterium]